jgi:hypothetical protein
MGEWWWRTTIIGVPIIQQIFRRNHYLFYYIRSVCQTGSSTKLLSPQSNNTFVNMGHHVCDNANFKQVCQNFRLKKHPSLFFLIISFSWKTFIWQSNVINLYDNIRQFGGMKKNVRNVSISEKEVILLYWNQKMRSTHLFSWIINNVTSSFLIGCPELTFSI